MDSRQRKTLFQTLPKASFVWTVGDGCTLKGVVVPVTPPREVLGVAWEAFAQAKEEIPTLEAGKHNGKITPEGAPYCL